jgi:RNA polymerase sigma-70 factor (ECF subfamily)
MHWRRRRSAPEGLELAEGLEPAAGFGPERPGDPEAVFLVRERAGLVHAALDGLPDHYARALEWKYLDRLSVEEIASRLGVKGKAAESLLTRARQAFRASYEGLQAGGGAWATGHDEEGPHHG